MNRNIKMRESVLTPSAFTLKWFMNDSKYKSDIKESDSIEEFLEKIGKHDSTLKNASDGILDLIKQYKDKDKAGYQLLMQFFHEAKAQVGSPMVSGRENYSLKKYLLKRLSISEKEASLIESVVRQYVAKKKVSEVDAFPKHKIKNYDRYGKDELSDEDVFNDDEYDEYNEYPVSSHTNNPYDETPVIPYMNDEEESYEDFANRLRLPKPRKKPRR
jgi:hypothetical protein